MPSTPKKSGDTGVTIEATPFVAVTGSLARVTRSPIPVPPPAGLSSETLARSTPGIARSFSIVLR